MITVRGGKDAGDVRYVDGEWYVRQDSFYIDAAEMEDGWDITMETGWYSNVKLAETPEELALVAEQEMRAHMRTEKMYLQNNTACFHPYRGQRVLFCTGESGVIIDVIQRTQSICKQIAEKTVWLEQAVHMVTVQGADKSNTSIQPYYLTPQDDRERLPEFIDLNEVHNG